MSGLPQITPAVQQQENEALLLFLRQRCTYLAQMHAIEQQLTKSLREELDQAKTQLSELQHQIAIGGANG